ncbi:hypothetical protein IC235_16995 [Hymenobacter sp. BT664]|uniref:RHS repeat-associated core domain-containing protein n=1 Tax=Hymenobacter montanus TaxID=2771359 RepID=A0A927BGP7_9BACT|nr:hypothetical protein [Hymenobacter montanus]MBD2769588.1 hypothetical protein [Hymenobacter montanus]
MLVFDADSNLVSQQTQQLSAAALNNYESLRLQVVVPQDGYVSAYVGNESNVDVFFDDVTVEHRQGLQVQETQYDPTGLELAGLTRETPGLKPLNQYRWNGKEFQADLGLNWTQLDWRMFDAQIDRLPGVDPEVENGQEALSPYAFSYDNAVRFNDPDGRNPGGGVPVAQIVMPPPGIVEETVQTLQEVSLAIGLIGAAVAAGTWVTNNMPSAQTLEEVFKGGDAGMPAGLEVPLMRQWVLNSVKSGDNLSRTGRPLPKSQTNGGRAMDPKTKQPIGGDGVKPRPVTVNKGTFKQAKDAARNDRANGGR